MTTSVGTKSSETESAGETKNETQWTPLYGRWLRERREQKGISTSDLERSLGVSTARSTPSNGTTSGFRWRGFRRCSSEEC